MIEIQFEIPDYGGSIAYTSYAVAAKKESWKTNNIMQILSMIGIQFEIPDYGGSIAYTSYEVATKKEKAGRRTR